MIRIILKTILTFIILLMVFINSILYIEYLDRMDSLKIDYMNCRIWENKEIPQKLTESQKWKLITTIGECKIISKQHFLEQNINNANYFEKNLYYTQNKHMARVIGKQAQLYLNDFKGK